MTNRTRGLILKGVVLVLLTFLLGLSCSGSNFSYGGSGEERPPQRIPNSLEKRINWADVIVRATLVSTSSTVDSPDWSNDYVGAVAFRFRVLEYLKGSGSTDITVFATDAGSQPSDYFDSRSDATDRGDALKGVHDTTWDERQAILFLRSDVEPSGKSGDSEDNYYIGSIGLVAGESYMITDTTHIVWLPEALNPSTGTRDSTGEQYFLTDVPNTQATGASGWSSQVEDPNVALSFLKGRIAAIAGEIATGDGSEEYELCVKDKYRWEQSILGQMALYKERGEDYYQTFTHTMMSGTPAGELVYTGGHYLKLSAETAANEPDDADLFVVLSGPDAELFEKGWPLTVLTAQPLPTGEYVFYHAERGRRQMPCDAMPELHRTRYKVVVTVTPPPNTLHEAFFDPVTIGTAIGADSSNGVIKPAGFTVDGTSTSITGLKWENGSVVLSLSPYSSLSGHKLDFIELDGSVSLSLPASSATADSTAGTLTWSVSDQPWHDGDLLMLRIFPHN